MDANQLLTLENRLAEVGALLSAQISAEEKEARSAEFMELARQIRALKE